MAYKRTPKKGAPYWEDCVRFPKPGGGYTTRWVRGRTRAEASRAKAKLLEERDRTPRGKARPNLRMSELGALFKERHVDIAKRSTKQMYATALRDRIAPYLYEMRVRDLTAEDVEDWMAKLRHAGVGVPTVNAARATLVVMLNKARKWGYIERNVAEDVPKLKHGRKQITVYAPDEIQSIAVSCRTRRLELVGKRGGPGAGKAEYWAARDMSMVMTLAFSGLRIGELMALRWQDDQGDYLRVRESLDATTMQLGLPKSSHERTVPILSPVRGALDWWASIGPKPHRANFIFPSDRSPGRPQSPSNWRSRVFRPAAEAAGYPDATPHELRHTFVSLMIAKNVSAKRLAMWIGHSDPVITMRTYAHLFDRVEADVVARVDASLFGD